LTNRRQAYRMPHPRARPEPPRLASYHKRSNVETAFSMIKRKFGDFVRSKTDVAMANEALCKVLAHNLVVLIHEMYELGVEPAFWPDPAV
jgi:hypothetical protein